MDDGRGRRAAVRKGVHVRHHVVPELALLLGRHGEVDVLLVALHLLDLGLCDGQTQRLEDARQRERWMNEEPSQLLWSRQDISDEHAVNSPHT